MCKMHDFKKLQNKFGEGVNIMPYYLNIGDIFFNLHWFLNDGSNKGIGRY